MAEGKSGARNGRFANQLGIHLGSQVRNAVGHPLRRSILRALAEVDGPKEVDWLQRVLDVPGAGRGKIAYHVGVLRKADVIATAPCEDRAEDTFYIPISSRDAAFAALVDAIREDVDWAKPDDGRAATYGIPRPGITVRLRSATRPGGA